MIAIILLSLLFLYITHLHLSRVSAEYQKPNQDRKYLNNSGLEEKKR